MTSSEELRQAIEACTRCSIGKLYTRKHTVPAWAGPNYDGKIAVMCEAPGAQEDETGIPLVGRAGQLFDRLLAAAGLDRGRLLLLNRVRCRPTGNNLKAHPDAVPRCHPWTVAEIREYDPKVVVAMGATAFGDVFGANVKVGETRGTVRRTGEDDELGPRIWIATYHPASLLRPGGKENAALVIGDLLLAKTLANA